MIRRNFFITLLSLLSAAAGAQEISIQDRLATQQFFLTRYDSLFVRKETRTLKSFHAALQVAPKEARTRALQLVKNLDSVVPERILMPLVYWRAVSPDTLKLQEVLEYYLAYRYTILRDYIDHPLDGAYKAAAKKMLASLFPAGGDTLNGFSDVAKMIGAEASSIARGGDGAFIQGILGSRALTENLAQRIPDISEYSLSHAGFIPGNRVELVSKNDRSMERINWFNERVIFGGGKLDFSLPWMKMPSTENPEGHIVFQQDPIYIRIREMIDSAQDSIFINIFLFGGTLGGTLAKHLIDKTIEKARVNPAFRTFFLHDYATNYNMKEEMMPVFEYMKSRIEKEPAVRKHFLLLQANIQRHPPGIPFGVTNLIPKTDEVFKEVEKMNTYFESKIDHSKVIVVDPESDRPKAYFGSKNWTDHSGGYYYDDALYVEGPAAALVQASYYDDVDAALTTDPKERKWFFFKEQGFDNARYLEERDTILAEFRVDRASFPKAGDEIVRLAEANVDGRIKDVRNMLIDRIRKARKSIYMEQLFVYDKYVNDAIMKRKVQVPGLDVRIVADHNGNFGMNGLPNTLFLKEMQSYGIKVRARRTVGVTTTLPNGEKRSYHQENHRKISSIDGEYLMIGSSNLNPDTLQGSFREFGAEVFDKKLIGSFEMNFLSAWNSDEETAPLDMDGLKLKVLGKSLTEDQSKLLNDIGAQILRSKDDLENRY